MLTVLVPGTHCIPDGWLTEHALNHFQGEVNRIAPLLNKSLSEDDILQEGLICRLQPATISRLRQAYESALTEKRTAQQEALSAIPETLCQLHKKLEPLPAKNTARLQAALTDRKNLTTKRGKVKDWRQGSITITAAHQREQLDEEIKAQNQIIDEEEGKHRARHYIQQEIEATKARETNIKKELEALADIPSLVANFDTHCQGLTLDIPTVAPAVPTTPLQREVVTKTEELLRPSRAPMGLPLWMNWRNAAIALGFATLAGGGLLAVKKYQAQEAAELESKIARVGMYFPRETVEKMSEEQVSSCATLGAQLKDANRNHGWNLSDEKIVELVWLGDPLKVYILEPRFEWGNPLISDKIKKRWDTFFAQNRAEVMKLFSEEKYADIVSLMRDKDEVFALIPKNERAYIASGEIGVIFHISGENNLCLDFIVGDEIVPEEFRHFAAKMKSDIEEGKVRIKDIGIVEKYGEYIEYISNIIGIDRSKFVIMANPLIGGEFLKISIQNIDENSPDKGTQKQAIIKIGGSLRHFAQKEDPEGIEIMAQANRANNLHAYINIMVAESIQKVIHEKSDEVVPELQKIQAEFQNIHREFPTEFLARLERYVSDEVKRGPLGDNFGEESITVLCNAIGQNGVETHVYICRADKVFFSGNTVISADGVYPAGMYVREQKALEDTLRRTFIQNPSNDVSHLEQKIPDGTIRIQPGSICVMPLPFGKPGANFGAILQYVSIYPSSGRHIVGDVPLPKFGLEIGSSLSLPRGLESKAFFHPLEIQAIQEAFMKVPGLAGNPVTVNFILYEGKKRAVATVATNNNQKIDILLPEAEETAINTTMTPEDQEMIKRCIAESTTGFTQHGAILKLGSDITSKISEGFRARLTDLTAKPGFINGVYVMEIKIKLIDGTFYETSISATELSKMIEAYLTGIIEEQKVLSQVDYLVKLNGASSFGERVQNIGHLSLLQSKIPEPTYHIDLVRSGITVNALGEPILRVIFMIAGHQTVFGFELSAKGRYKN